jgi:hypothetical protein
MQDISLFVLTHLFNNVWIHCVLCRFTVVNVCVCHSIPTSIRPLSIYLFRCSLFPSLSQPTEDLYMAHAHRDQRKLQCTYKVSEAITERRQNRDLARTKFGLAWLTKVESSVEVKVVKSEPYCQPMLRAVQLSSDVYSSCGGEGFST